MAKTLFIDYSVCIGCESCEAACRFLHKSPRIHMTRTSDGLTVPLYCRHCERAACMKACPFGALTRDADGAVIQEPLICRGCDTKPCIMACPFGAMFVTPTGVNVRTCDLCASRRAKDMGPACVEICPTAAIKYVERDDIESLSTDEAKAAEKKVLSHIRPVLKKPA